MTRNYGDGLYVRTGVLEDHAYIVDDFGNLVKARRDYLDTLWARALTNFRTKQGGQPC